jgi:hypothetical protein
VITAPSQQHFLSLSFHTPPHTSTCHRKRKLRRRRSELTAGTGRSVRSWSGTELTPDERKLGDEKEDKIVALDESDIQILKTYVSPSSGNRGR